MEKTKTTEQAINLWKELGVRSVNFNFSCGGDSMNDTDIVILTENGDIKNDVLWDYFDIEVYNKVEFYVNSDGHYNGENGVVEITLDEEEGFIYDKSAESEWNEQQTESVFIKLTDAEQEFIRKNILNINGEESNLEFVFKGDVFLTDEDEVFLEKFKERILEEIENNQPVIDEGELQEYYTYNTEEDNLKITEDGKIEIIVNYSVTVYRQD